MILQELSRYYQRLLEDPEASVPVENWSSEKAAWELRIAEDGRLMGVTPLTAGEGKDLRRFIVMQVPEHTSRTAGVLPFFLCDNAAYLLGLDEKRGEEKRACAAELHQAVLGGCDDEGARAVLAFFERDDALAVGKRTLCVMLGRRAMRAAYLLNAVIAVALSLPVWLTMPAAARVIPVAYLAAAVALWRMLGRRSGSALNPLLGMTAMSMLAYAVAFAIAAAIS